MPRQQNQHLDSAQGGPVADAPPNTAGDADEPMEEDVEQEGYASSTPTSSLTWITWFCSLPGHEYFCEVGEEFIEDDFNLTGLNVMVPYWKEAMEMVLDVEPEEDSLRIPDVSLVEASAELLYGLVHQRYILTRAGLHAMLEKYQEGQFGVCPRVHCQASSVVPCGRSDFPGVDTVKLYCPNCNDIYTPASSRFQSVDGAFFGTTYAHLFLQSYREFAPVPFYSPPSGVSSSMTRSPTNTPGNSGNQPESVNPNPHGGQKPAAGIVYVPRIYGFKVSERAKSGPRMRWLRLRPAHADELDQVDWRGRWLTSDEEYDEEDEDEDGELEDFDPDAIGEDDEDEDEEEEEDEVQTGAQHRQDVVMTSPRRLAGGPSDARNNIRQPTSFAASMSPTMLSSPTTRVTSEVSATHPTISVRGPTGPNGPTRVKVVRTVTTESHPKITMR